MMDMIKAFLQEKMKRRKWHAVLAALACVVIFGTTYALISPALTMTAETFCGLEEHTHEDACYESMLICESGDAAGEQAGAHTHEDTCYETQQVLSCGESEETGHVHSADCYTSVSVLVCTESVEASAHEHTDACYEKTPICGKEEHTHTLACYSDPNADLESAASWEQTGLTGVWAEDLVTVAQSQLGYEESEKNYIVTEDGTIKGITRYGQWYGDPYGDWNAMFVSFCLNYAGIPQTAVPYASSCAAWETALRNAGLYRSGAYVPEKGDIVLFDQNGDGAADHAGIVVQVSENGSSFRSVEGDVANSVQWVRHLAGESEIAGYAALPENSANHAQDPEIPDDEQPSDDAEEPEHDEEQQPDDTEESEPDEEQQPDDTEELIPGEELPAGDALASEDELQMETAAEAELLEADAEDVIESIAVGESKTLSVGAGETVKLSFTPEYTHEYVFYSSASADTYGYLYDANGTQKASNDDGGGNAQFKVTYPLTAGETYYWGARWYYGSRTGDIPVHLEFGTHSYTENEQGELVCVCGAVAPTSGSCGDNLYWSVDEESGTLTITGTGKMTDFSTSKPVPWTPYLDKIREVKIEEGATTIGNYAFSNVTTLEKVSFPSSLTHINLSAFNGCTGLTEADLSGTSLTYISSYGFYGCTSLQNVSFPATLTGIGEYAFKGCRALTGIDLSGTAVTSIERNTFEGCNALQEVALPSTLNSIKDGAFYNCKALTEVHFPGNQLSSIGESAFAYCSSLKELDLGGTGATSIGKSAFEGCYALEKIVLPKTLTSISNILFINCSKLSQIVIPETVTSWGSRAFSGCDSLRELRLEAENITIDASQDVLLSGFHVTVGKTVDTLTADALDTLKAMGCTGVTFEGPSYLTGGGWQADFLPNQLKGLPQGEYFIDAKGVFYRIDSETNTASVFYCPPGIESYIVLGELPKMGEKEEAIPVTGVDSEAFSEASDLTALIFKSPETITRLDDLAFFGAGNLEKINGQSTAQEVLATFTSKNLQTGTMLFRGTKITDSSEQISGDALVIEKDELQLTITTEQGEYREPGQSEGTYLYYTGEAARTTITVSNPDSSEDVSGEVVRVYFRFDEQNGSINYAPGTYTLTCDSGSQYTMTVAKTDRTGCYYLEMERPKKGDTISLTIESSYPSPTSGGGNAIVWGAILSEEERESVGTGLTPVSTYQSMNWTTVPDTFPISKTETYTGSAQIKGDGAGGAYISGLRYTIDMSRDGTTLEGVGKDHVSSVDFEDVLTLPEGAVLAEDVLTSLRNGTVKIDVSRSSSSSYDAGYRFKTADGRIFLTVQPKNYYSDYMNLASGSIHLDENGNLVVCWRFINADTQTEIANTSFTYRVYDNTILVPEVEADKTYVVYNKVTANEHFMYSEDQVQEDDCSATVKVSDSRLVIDKSKKLSASNYGEPEIYLITASNPGALPYERLASLTDDLPKTLYMRPEDLAATFAEDTDHQLTITITNATLCKGSGGTVSGMDGSTVTVNTQNSGSGTQYSGMSTTDPDAVSDEASTITITWGADGMLQISVADGNTYSCNAEESDIQSVLDGIGLVVTPETRYCLKWDLTNEDGTVPPLVGGGEIQKNVYCACKDTFMLLSNDTQTQHPSRYYTYTNNVYAWDSANEKLGSDFCGASMSREFSITKNWAMNGEAVDSETTIQDGDVLDYTLSIIHSGKGQYDALPLVDHMSGAQALLVPTAKNSGAEWAQGLETVERDGAEYYVLSKPGTYRNVWTSEDQLADSVEVTESTSGLDTLIKWYFVNYTGSRTDTVTYRSYVCPSKTTGGALSFSLGNESWLNDHSAHRLYATLPGWKGTTFEFDKKIVDAVGDTGDGCIYSAVSEGQKVVYRLELSSPVDPDGNSQQMTVTGSDMYDALPLSISTYRWSKENVCITYQDDVAVTNGENWSVAEPEAGDQQYIRWSDNFSMTFTGTAYIYVELTFPSDTAWQEYAVKYGASKLTNTFYVLSAQRSVTHEVSTAAKVYLQKGVDELSYFYYPSSGSRKSTLTTQDGRLYYQNNDTMIRAVEYYVALYNEGPTNLYLTDMQDILPKGFTYSSYFSKKFYTNINYGKAYTQIISDDSKKASKKYAQVTVATSTDESGRQHLSFSFTQPAGTLDAMISYDAERGMCYLKPGEAIEFVYVCMTNETEETEDTALNTVTMPYYDFNGGGVVVDDGCSIVGCNSDKYTPNDGGCDLWSNGQVEGFGFTGSTNDTQWLTSQVTQIRGEIKPGITKALTSKTDQNGKTTQNPVSAAPSDTLNWTITAENDGTNSITDYVLTDTMQSPYLFTGAVSYRVYTSASSSGLIAKPNASDYLFTLAKGSDDAHLVVTSNLGATQELTIGGEAITVSCNWNYSLPSATSSTSNTTKNVDVLLSIAKDDSGNGILSLRFADSSMAIPGGGRGQLTISTYNAINALENKQFVNTCFITPMSQTWDNTTNKGNVVTLQTPYGEGELPTVRNSAPVTTSYGYVTSSVKRITEVDDETNTAACTDEKNYIVLSDASKQFTYTLTVNNSTNKAMDKFILIDGLPETGDHTAFLASDSRFSEFKVSLAENPAFAVTVTDENGNVTVLDESRYSIAFSKNTEFSDEDWKGTSTWSTSAESARSIRLMIDDPEGTLIPAGSTVSLSFICKIDDPNAQPGQVAWNSFGYHYSLLEDSTELEAAPLKVGVKIPSVPELRKQTVDHAGQARAAEKDETFRFLVYQGKALSGEYTTEEEWAAALGETPYEVFTVTVKEGESISESVRLQTTKWEWTEGQQYTIVELQCGEDYAFKRFTGATGSSYTLTYTSDQTQIITCENTNLRWSIALTKESDSQEALSGAVFALYSPEESDQLPSVPEKYEDYHIALTTEQNGKTWYLKDIATTPKDGKLTWSDLLLEEYYLLEVKAPSGYYLSATAGQILKQERETQGVYALTVVNEAGYSLPVTGGAGTLPFAISGLLMTAGSLLYGCRKHRKRERRSA